MSAVVTYTLRYIIFMMSSLSPVQTLAIDITEKIGSVLSLLGATFVIATFLCNSNFRKPINRLVFYASWGNIVSNVATLIGTSAIKLGPASRLCQFQAFMIQWFMPADALWTFMMACNVYLSFFHHYNASQLRALKWRYALLCYGLPFIPAFAYFFVHDSHKGPVYGDAVLWCWISIHWDFLRVAVFYGPAWVVILLTMSVYVRVGQLIRQWRKELKFLGDHSDQELQRNPRMLTPEFGIRRTDEVTITTELAIRADNVQRSHRFRPDLRKPDGTTSATPPVPTYTAKGGPAARCTYRDASSHANKAMIKYCYCAMLFFVALLCTWVPSSINRIYTLVYPTRTPFGQEYAAALVLPLQGFWNFVVYVTTSHFACGCLWRDILASFKKHYGHVFGQTARDANRPAESQHKQKRSRTGESYADTVSLKRGSNGIDCSRASVSPLSEIQLWARIVSIDY